MCPKGTQNMRVLGFGRNFWSVAILFEKFIISSLPDSTKSNSDRKNKNSRTYGCLKSWVSEQVSVPLKLHLQNSTKRNMLKTSVGDIFQKFRQYRKNKGTFRRSIWVKDHVYKLYIAHRDNLDLYPHSYWTYRPKNWTKLRDFDQDACCQ